MLYLMRFAGLLAAVPLYNSTSGRREQSEKKTLLYVYPSI